MASSPLLRYLLVASLLFSCILGSIYALEVTRTTVQYKNANILGVPMKFAEFKVDFDGDVYHQQAYDPCTNFDCAPPADTSAPAYVCDATQPGFCSDTNPICSTYRDTLCSGTTPNFQVLKYGEWKTELIEPGNEQVFVYYVNDSMGCNFISYTADPIWGDPNLQVYALDDWVDYVNGAPFEDQRPLREALYFGPDRVTVCPGQVDYPFAYGTHVISVVPFDSVVTATGPRGSKYEIQVDTHPLPPMPNTPPCTVPTGLPTMDDETGLPITWQCLTDGIVENFTSAATEPDYQYYVYTVPAGAGCKNVFWYFSALEMFLSNGSVPLGTTFFEAVDKNLVSFGGNPKGDFLTICATETEPFHLTMKVFPTPSDAFRTPEADINKVLVDSSQNWRWRQRIVDKKPYVATWDLQMSSQLVCKQKTTKRQCNFRIEIWGDPSECSRFWHVYPSEQPNPVFPLNTWLFGDQRFINYYPLDLPTPLERSYMAYALLEIQSTPNQAPTIPQGNDEETISTCDVVFMGSIVDQNGEPIPPTPLRPTRIDAEPCNAEKFQNAVARLANFTKIMDDSSGLELTGARLSIDLIPYSPAYYDCNALASVLPVTETITRSVESEVCVGTGPNDPVYETDPCCDRSLSFNGPDCVPRFVTTTTQRFTELTRTAEQQCEVGGSSVCSDLFVADYVAAASNARSVVEGCGANTENLDVFRGQLLSTYRACRDYVLGQYPERGHACTVDADCTLLPGATCNPLRGSCNYKVDDLSEALFKCWVPQADSFILNTVGAYFNVTDVNNATEWVQALSSPDCTGTYNWGFGVRSTYKRSYTSPSNAPTCDSGSLSFGFPWYCNEGFCVDRFCYASFACQFNLQSNVACQTFPAPPLPVAADCSASNMCSWTDSYSSPTAEKPGFANPISSTDCLAPTSVCVACGSGAPTEEPCLAFDAADQTDCTSSFACRLNNGSWVKTDTAQECEDLMTCDTPCYDADGTLRECTPSECSSGTAGMCEDLIWSTDMAAGTYITTCLAPPETLWGVQGCRATAPPNSQYGRPTPLGCMYYPTTTCADIDASLGEDPGYTTQFFPSYNESTCTNPSRQVCNQTWYDGAFLNDRLLTLKNPETCVEFGGIVQNATNWKPATYAGGVAYPLTWQTPTYGPRLTQRNTLDFGAFDVQYVNAMDVKYSYSQRSEAFCRYNRLTSALTPIVCSCASDGARSSSCYPSVTVSSNSVDLTEAVAVLNLCPSARPITQQAPPAILTFNSSNLAECQDVYVNIVQASTQAQSSAASVNTFLLDFRVDQSYQFTNSRKALIGQIVGDGIALTAARENQLSNVLICVIPRADIPSYSKSYTVLDYGELDLTSSSATIKFLNVPSYFDEALGAQCGLIPIVRASNAYFPIKRVADPASAKPGNFSTGAKVFYGFMCAIYLSIAALSFWRFINVFVVGAFELRNTQVWIFLTVGIMLFIRGIYVLLVVTGVVVNNNSSAIGYILIELPSFLYFTVMTYFIIIWATLIRVNRKLSRRKNNANFWTLFFAINGVIYGIFIILIIIYESVKPTTRNLCGGRFAFLDSTSRQRVSVAYRAILAGFTLIISLSFFITGFSIYSTLMGGPKLGGPRAQLKKKIFILTTICSAGLVCLSTLLIVLAATKYQNNYTILSLLVVFECIPCLTIVIALWDPRTRENMSDTGKTNQSVGHVRSMVTGSRSAASEAQEMEEAAKSSESSTPLPSDSSDSSSESESEEDEEAS